MLAIITHTEYSKTRKNNETDKVVRSLAVERPAWRRHKSSSPNSVNNNRRSSTSRRSILRILDVLVPINHPDLHPPHRALASQFQVVAASDVPAAADEPVATAATTTTTSSTPQALTVRVGVLVAPPAGTKLGRCEGDCDWDSECAPGLVCFYRSDNSAVPGCDGDTPSKYSHDFCIDPNDKVVGTTNTNDNNPSPIPPAPQQSNIVPSPTLPPATAPTRSPALEASVLPPVESQPLPTTTTGTTLSLQVIVGVGAMLPNGKLGRCQGDCDSDEECADGLLCRQRTDNSKVPGCTGELIGFRTGIDFCYDPADDDAGDSGAVPPAPTSTAPTPTATTPDKQNLPPVPPDSPVPLQPTPAGPVRPTSSATPVAVLSAPDEDMTPGTNYLEIIGNSTEVSNLGRCKADCNKDEDCFEGFVCYQKYSPHSYVPGCIGIGKGVEDYCIDPRDNPINIHRDRFRLKLFWRTGYRWQEETVERKWCMECADRRCHEGGDLVISKCDDDGSNEEFHFVYRDGLELSVQVAGTELCLEAPIATLFLTMQICNSTKKEQRFRPGIGDWDWDRFELEAVAAPGCITQRHHPKEGERLYREDCDLTRNDRTSLWNKYQ